MARLQRERELRSLNRILRSRGESNRAMILLCAGRFDEAGLLLVCIRNGSLEARGGKRYAEKIPVVSGDYTPYWENGACSSARETAINRTAAERLAPTTAS